MLVVGVCAIDEAPTERKGSLCRGQSTYLVLRHLAVDQVSFVPLRSWRRES